MDRDKKDQLYMEEQTSLALEKATAFVKKNIVPAKKGRKCVDGRYDLDTEDTGRIARPGGDAGYVEALLAVNEPLQLDLTPEQCFDLVYDAVTADGEPFFMHTDAHAEHEEHEAHETEETATIGCGHLAKATKPEFASGYGVDASKVAAVIKHAKKRQKEGANIRINALEHEHDEIGVLVVRGRQNSVNSNNGLMYFVYDQDRDEDFMKMLAEKLKARIPGLTYEAFKEASGHQLQATLHNLALGKPIFEVEADNNEPKVSFSGLVV
ncbi:MAG: hypothetical protein M1142_00640 [Patescibacteria group bacterium]|nr:hypothetical protein [Patescibacteria group bacterium]